MSTVSDSFCNDALLDANSLVSSGTAGRIGQVPFVPSDSRPYIEIDLQQTHILSAVEAEGSPFTLAFKNEFSPGEFESYVDSPGSAKPREVCEQ